MAPSGFIVSPSRTRRTRVIFGLSVTSNPILVAVAFLQRLRVLESTPCTMSEQSFGFYLPSLLSRRGVVVVVGVGFTAPIGLGVSPSLMSSPFAAFGLSVIIFLSVEGAVGEAV